MTDQTKNPNAPQKLIDIVAKYPEHFDRNGLNAASELNQLGVSNVDPVALSDMSIGELKAFVYSMAVQLDAFKDLLKKNAERDFDLVKAIAAIDQNSGLIRMMLSELDEDRLQVAMNLRQENSDLRQALKSLVQHLGIDHNSIPGLQKIMDSQPPEEPQPPTDQKPKQRGFNK